MEYTILLYSQPKGQGKDMTRDMLEAALKDEHMAEGMEKLGER